MLTYDLTQSGRLPLYEYLFRCIRRDIRTGKLSAGEKLPSKRRLAEHLSVSISTVEAAYGQLVGAGYIESRSKSGFFVCRGRDQGTAEADFPQEEETPEEDREIDFKANRCSMELFPISTWARLLRQVLSEQPAELLRTVPFNGLYILRRAIADYLYENRGMHVLPAQIVIGAGTEFLYERLLQLLGTKSRIAIEDPGYKKFAELSRGLGTKWDYIPVDAEGMCMEALRRSSANVAHVSPANQFPTGVVASRRRRRELLAWSTEAEERYLIEDDYDSELRFDGRRLPTLFAQDTAQKVIYLNTFSKTLVPSLRISYMILPQKLMERYRQRLSFYSCSVSSFEQYVLAKFISEGFFERHINRLRRYYKRRKGLVLEGITASSLKKICTVADCPVGTHFLLRMHTALSDAEIRAEAEARNIELALLSDYAYEQSAVVQGIIVLNFANLDEGNIRLAVGLLEDIFRADIGAAERRALPKHQN